LDADIKNIDEKKHEFEREHGTPNHIGAMRFTPEEIEEVEESISTMYMDIHENASRTCSNQHIAISQNPTTL